MSAFNGGARILMLLVASIGKTGKNQTKGKSNKLWGFSSCACFYIIRFRFGVLFGVYYRYISEAEYLKLFVLGTYIPTSISEPFEKSEPSVCTSVCEACLRGLSVNHRRLKIFSMESKSHSSVFFRWPLLKSLNTRWEKSLLYGVRNIEEEGDNIGDEI